MILAWMLVLKVPHQGYGSAAGDQAVVVQAKATPEHPGATGEQAFCMVSSARFRNSIPSKSQACRH